MRRIALAGLVLALATSSSVLAQPGSAKPNATTAPTAAPATSATSATPASSAPSSAKLPPGHPPPGHGAAPPNQARERITDRVVPDSQLPAGTIAVMIIDGDDRPAPNVPVTLAVLMSSVTKGEARERVVGTTDESGQVTFNDLKYGSGISYRVTTNNGMATFSSQPFGLTDQGGIRALQHRYDTVNTIGDSRLLMELHMVLDIKQDNVAISHLLVLVNLGREAYVASDVRIPFPKGYEAFSAQESMEGVGMVERDGEMVLEGTFPPGQTQITYRYQVPLDGGEELNVKLPVPPRVAASRVVLKANEQMSLKIAGYPAAERARWNDGAKVHEVRSQAPRTREEIAAAFSRNAPGTLDITISGIPTPGLKRTIAVLLALFAVLAGAYHVFRKRQHAGPEPDVLEDLEQAQQALLDELALLETFKQQQEIGPRTYQKVREQLLDALARIMSRRKNALAETNDARASHRPATSYGSQAGTEEATRSKPKRKKRARKRRKKRVAAEI